MVVASDDFLEELIGERTAGNADFPVLVDSALRRRQLIRHLTELRESMNLSQTWVAARMGTSQSAIARLERGEIDARFSTLLRYAASLGKRIEWSVTDEETRRVARSG
jgi:DNA-binding XRE family transcriptional regulator